MCWAVSAGALVHTAWYIADAPRGEGELIGGGESDWLVILDEYWGKLLKADVYAARLRVVAWVVWLGAVALVISGMVLAHRRAAGNKAPRSPKSNAEPARELAQISDEQMWG
jgi:hypothetical protein